MQKSILLFKYHLREKEEFFKVYYTLYTHNYKIQVI